MFRLIFNCRVIISTMFFFPFQQIICNACRMIEQESVYYVFFVRQISFLASRWFIDKVLYCQITDKASTSLRRSKVKRDNVNVIISTMFFFPFQQIICIACRMILRFFLDIVNGQEAQQIIIRLTSCGI
jgi:uncharacterized membrane protein